jgi:hypothetical protein
VTHHTSPKVCRSLTLPPLRLVSGIPHRLNRYRLIQPPQLGSPMPSLRRGLLSRLGVHVTPDRSGDLPIAIDRLSVGDDDASSIRSLPAYPYAADTPQRSASPAPTYTTIDQPPSFPVQSNQPVVPVTKPTQVEKQSAINEFVNRIRDSVYNTKSWRLNNDGRKCFFWALRCAPGTADMLHDSTQEIRDKVCGKRDWQVEKFCFMFQGQRFADLWCRPIDPVVFPTWT